MLQVQHNSYQRSPCEFSAVSLCASTLHEFGSGVV